MWEWFILAHGQQYSNTNPYMAILKTHIILKYDDQLIIIVQAYFNRKRRRCAPDILLVEPTDKHLIVVIPNSVAPMSGRLRDTVATV